MTNNEISALEHRKVKKISITPPDQNEQTAIFLPQLSLVCANNAKIQKISTVEHRKGKKKKQYPTTKSKMNKRPKKLQEHRV